MTANYHIGNILVMKLANYLSQTDKPRAEFAQEIGVSEVSLHRYLCKGRIPKPSVMDRIVRATGGLVTANDFFDTSGETEAA